jgi:PAS domain S-box-containing protein
MVSNDDRHISNLLVLRACDPLEVLRSAFGQSPNGVVVSRDDGTILFVNELASAILDYPLGELVGQPLARLLPGVVPEAHDAMWTRFWENPDGAAMLAGRTIAGMRRDRATVPLDISVSVVAEETTRYMIVSIVDVTERLNLEARLAAATHAHLGFQRLVADVAMGFATLDPAAVDEAIVDALRQVGETLQLDSAIVWQWRFGEASARPVHHWAQHEWAAPPDPLPTESIPFVAARLAAGECCCFATLDDLPDSDRDAFRRRGFRSGTLVPLAETGTRGPLLSALALGSTTREQEWTPIIIEGLRLIAGVIGQATARQADHYALQEALDEIGRLRDRMALENTEHQRETRPPRTSSPVISESSAIQRVLAQIDQVAPTPATVLLLGETGSGKELMAQAVHNQSPRHQRQMIRVNCAAIPVSLIESELFGREKGAYTGALSRQIGRFEAANQSTLFLDEIGDLPMEVQVKLLRVLQERVIERLGSTQPIKIDVRIIAATNHNLEVGVRDKTFREDLFYRLNVFPVVVPPLPRTRRRHPRAGVELHRRVLAVVRQARGHDFEGEPSRTAALFLARERPRVAQRHRTRGDPGLQPPFGRRDPAAWRTADAPDRDDAERARSRAHPLCPQEHRLARPRIRRSGRASRRQADHAREPDGQARHRAQESQLSAVTRSPPRLDRGHKTQRVRVPG